MSKEKGAEQKVYFFKTFLSPVGALKIVASEQGVAAIMWENDAPRRVPLQGLTEKPRHPVLRAAEKQLREYFAGKRDRFDLKLDFAGTPFQKRVWSELLKIPFGETRSYGEIARQVGRPKAVRAVGAANSRNPICIVAPCHRVIGSNGKLIGFAGGLPVKEYLLEMERKRA